ncbi:MAG TPA: methyltransferase [Pseudomonadales bacterium]
MLNTTHELTQRFARLTDLLHQQETLWRPVPFWMPVLPWQSQHTGLHRALLALSDAETGRLEADPTALAAWIAQYIPELKAIESLTEMPALPITHIDYPSRFEHDIPGRKWQQVAAFAGAMDPIEGLVLEWCAGKAHLGRAVSRRFNTPVIGLERNATLCRDGNALSEHHDLDVQLLRCNVMAADAAVHCQRADHAMALHACGDLHRRLIESVIEHSTRSLHLSPCCYHLTTNTHYRPFSKAGRDSGLALHRDELRLAVQETVTAPDITTPRRQQKNAWRLGFDLLQRQLRDTDHYLPVPSIPDRYFQGNFGDFCRHAAALKALPLPTDIDWPGFEQRGWQRQREVARMELPRHAFRRVLELWLVLDRALYLSECGYRVTLGTFCDRAITPRNILVCAQRMH